MCPTIRSINKYVESKGTSFGEDIDWASETKLPDDVLPPKNVSVLTTKSTLFMTGANGFLGSHILHKLLSDFADLQIVCGVLAANKEEAFKRLEAAFDASLLNKSLLVSKRLEIVTIDLSLPKLGLSDQQFVALANHVDGILHCAAAVSWATPYKILSKVNVFGTAQVR